MPMPTFISNLICCNSALLGEITEKVKGRICECANKGGGVRSMLET